MNELPSSHSGELSKYLELMRQNRWDIIPLYIASSLTKRTDSESVFDEGDAFGGTSKTNRAIACSTLVASPHVPRTVPAETFARTVRNVYGEEPSFPISGESYLSPQLIIWWKLANTLSAKSDFYAISLEDQSSKEDIEAVVGKQLERAVKTIQNLKGSAVIWGSWGNGLKQEREDSGRSRGGPTNPIGHMHVTHVEEALSSMPINGICLDTKEILNYCDPWMLYFNEKFAVVLQSFLSRTLSQLCVSEFSVDLIPDERRKGIPEGYNVRFAKGVDSTTLIAILMEVANKTESLYRELSCIYDDYQLSHFSSGDTDHVREHANELLCRFGFNEKDFEDIYEFMIRIRPTRIQLQRYSGIVQSEAGKLKIAKVIDRYQRIEEKLDADHTSKMSTLLLDTLRTNVNQIERTWPEHASFWYKIENEDYQFTDDHIRVNSIQLYALIASSSTAPQRILNGLISRSLK